MVRNRYGRAAGMLAAVVVLLGACGDARDPGTDDVDPTATATATAESTGPPAPAPPGDETGPAEEYPPQVGAAVEDLAAHLSVPVEEIAVVSYTDVTWPDGSLGCPQPGMSYTQALVPGSRLVLAAQDQEYAYHSGRDSELTRCDNPQPPAAQSS